MFINRTTSSGFVFSFVSKLIKAPVALRFTHSCLQQTGVLPQIAQLSGAARLHPQVIAVHRVLLQVTHRNGASELRLFHEASGKQKRSLDCVEQVIAPAGRVRVWRHKNSETERWWVRTCRTTGCMWKENFNKDELLKQVDEAARVYSHPIKICGFLWIYLSCVSQRSKG